MAKEEKTLLQEMQERYVHLIGDQIFEGKTTEEVSSIIGLNEKRDDKKKEKEECDEECDEEEDDDDDDDSKKEEEDDDDEDDSKKDEDKSKSKKKNKMNSPVAPSPTTAAPQGSSSVMPKKNEKPKAKGKGKKNAFDMKSLGQMGAGSSWGTPAAKASGHMKNDKKKKSKNEALEGMKSGGFETHVICKCGNHNLKLSEKKTMLRCSRCGYTDLIENITGVQ